MEEPAAEATIKTEEQATQESGDSLLSESTQQTKQGETGAPETYDFKNPEGLPEGADVDQKILDAYSEAARGADLPQDKAQGMFDKVMTSLHERGLEAQEEQRNEWAKQAQADPDFGGDKLDENLGIAKKAIEQFGSEGLRDLLDSSTGLGNHPELIRFMVGVGKALSEDRFVGSNQGQTVDPNDDAAQARRLYPSSK